MTRHGRLLYDALSLSLSLSRARALSVTPRHPRHPEHPEHLYLFLFFFHHNFTFRSPGTLSHRVVVRIELGIPGIPGIPGILGVQPKFKSNKEAVDNPPANSIEMMLSMDVENPRHPWHLRDRNGVHRWVQSLETWNESLVDGEPTLRIPRSSGIPRISRISPEDPITVVNERKPASFFLCASVVSGGGGEDF